MAQMLNIGKQFVDFSSLEIAIQQYQKEENVQFFSRSSRTIEKAQSRVPDKKLNERLKYNILWDIISLYTRWQEL